MVLGESTGAVIGANCFVFFFQTKCIKNVCHAGSTGVRRSRARNPIPDVEASDRFHGNVAQKRRGGETLVEIHIAHDCGRFHHVPDRIPGGRPIRIGRVHAGDIVVVVVVAQVWGGEWTPPRPSSRQRRRQQRCKRRKAPAHPLLQIPD